MRRDNSISLDIEMHVDQSHGTGNSMSSSHFVILMTSFLCAVNDVMFDKFPFGPSCNCPAVGDEFVRPKEQQQASLDIVCARKGV